MSEGSCWRRRGSCGEHGIVNSQDQATFEQQRPRLLSLSYRMLGERAAAEDIVQDAWIAWNQADRRDIRNPAGWLTKATTRLAIDALRSARARREKYLGPWLPEPLLIESSAGPADAFAHARECELALLWAMERLSPEERSAFILRQVFDSDYADLAAVIGKSQAACRKLVSRAKRKVQDIDPDKVARREDHTQMLLRFAQACSSLDHAQVLQLLAPDVQAFTDGGGRVRAALRPLVGAAEVTQVAISVTAKANAEFVPRLVEANGMPALAISGSEQNDMITTIRVNQNGLIDWIYIMRNPDKLPLPH